MIFIGEKFPGKKKKYYKIITKYYYKMDQNDQKIKWPKNAIKS